MLYHTKYWEIVKRNQFDWGCQGGKIKPHYGLEKFWFHFNCTSFTEWSEMQGAWKWVYLLRSATLQRLPMFDFSGQFSLFSVVSFPNDACTSQSDNSMQGKCEQSLPKISCFLNKVRPLSGVCYSQDDCSDKGGSADGNCANGFGVCCMIRYNVTLLPVFKFSSMLRLPILSFIIPI